MITSIGAEKAFEKTQDPILIKKKKKKHTQKTKNRRQISQLDKRHL